MGVRSVQERGRAWVGRRGGEREREGEERNRERESERGRESVRAREFVGLVVGGSVVCGVVVDWGCGCLGPVRRRGRCVWAGQAV